MSNAALTPEQEAVANKIDTAGLALIGTGVLGGLLHQHGVPGGAVNRAGKALHDVGPYLDLAGLALLAPPVMHRVARKLAPAQQGAPEAPAAMPMGEIPVAGQQERPTDDLEALKQASYVLGAAAARSKIAGTR